MQPPFGAGELRGNERYDAEAIATAGPVDGVDEVAQRSVPALRCTQGGRAGATGGVGYVAGVAAYRVEVGVGVLPNLTMGCG